MDDTQPRADEPLPLGATSPITARSARSAASWVALAMAFANGLGYLLNLVATRALGPTQFGALGALLGLVLIGNVVALGLQTVTARVLAGRPGAARDEAAQLYRLALWCAVAIAGVALLAAPLVGVLLHLGGAGAAWWLPVVFAALTVTGVQLGLLQGAEQFRALAGLYVVAAVGKVGGGLLGLLVGGSVTSTVAGTAAGTVGSAVAGHLMVRHLASRAGPARAFGRLPEVLHATHALLVLFVLTNTDVLLARHYLPGPEAGRYAVGAVVAKGAFWFPGFVGVVALPALADTLRRKQAAARAVAAVAACGIVVTVGAALFGHLVVALVGGAAYDSLSDRVWLFAAAGSLYAMAQLLLYSRLAAGDHRALVVVWGALLLLLALVVGWRHGSATEVITSVLVAASAVVVVGLLAEVREHGGGRGGAAPS